MKNREYRKKKGDELEAKTGKRTTQAQRDRTTRYFGQVRLKCKLETGKTYRNAKEEKRQREYARAHNKRTDELTEEQKQKRRNASKRYSERRRMKEFVNELSAIDFNDIF